MTCGFQLRGLRADELLWRDVHPGEGRVPSLGLLEQLPEERLPAVLQARPHGESLLPSSPPLLRSLLPLPCFVIPSPPLLYSPLISSRVLSSPLRFFAPIFHPLFLSPPSSSHTSLSLPSLIPLSPRTLRSTRSACTRSDSSRVARWRSWTTTSPACSPTASPIESAASWSAVERESPQT